MEITKELYDELCELGIAYLNEAGQEVNNPKPLFSDVTPKPIGIKEQIQRLMRVELSKQAQMQGHESFEDSNDFDVKDDFETDEIETKYQQIQEEFFDDGIDVASEKPDGENAPSEKDASSESETAPDVENSTPKEK